MNPRLWFYDNKINIFPVDRRDKSPTVPKGTSQFDYRCSRIQAAEMGDYGVPLGLLAVADSDDVAAESWVRANLPDTPFKVTTARGRHRYYRLVGDAPHFFHRNSLTIEFRHAGQYVIGPGSVHKTGVVYTAGPWSWNILDVPLFPVADFRWDDRPLDQRGTTEGGAPLVLPPIIQAGERHSLMFKLMRSLQARGVTDVEALLKVLRVENQLKCSPPISDQELERYIRRVSKYRDRPGFERPEPQDEGTLAGGLLEAGVSVAGATAAAITVNPLFDPNGGEVVEFPEFEQPSQPSQPALVAPTCVPTAPEGVPTLGNPESPAVLQNSTLACGMCAHQWMQRRKDPPKRCPRCDSTLWNREPIIDMTGTEEGGEILDLNEDDDKLEVIDEEEDDSEIYEEPEEDGPIYDEDGDKIVGHVINGVTVWKDTK